MPSLLLDQPRASAKLALKTCDLQAKTGLLSNHHFLPPKDKNTFSLFPGEYVIDIYARTIMRSATVLLSTVKVALTGETGGVAR
jgi:hypothetical protein